MKQSLRNQAEVLAAQKYTVEVAYDETTDGEPIFLLSHPELPGCMAQGLTIEQAQENLHEATIDYIQSLLEDKAIIPHPMRATTTGTSVAITETLKYPSPKPEPDFFEDIGKVSSSRTRQPY